VIAFPQLVTGNLQQTKLDTSNIHISVPLPSYEENALRPESGPGPGEIGGPPMPPPYPGPASGGAPGTDGAPPYPGPPGGTAAPSR